jgi:CBS domain-containing protein
VRATISCLSRMRGEGMSVTLGQLLEESPKLEVARPGETVAAAMERMFEHDYSQLPVVAEDEVELRAIGLISTKTIARASLYLDIPPTQLRVHHALDGHPIKKRVDDDLWRTLDETRQGEVLLVEDEAGVLRGILTGQDFTAYLRQQSEDSLTVRDIESTIKQLIVEHYHEREGELREAVERVLGVHQRSLQKSVWGVAARCLNAASANIKNVEEVFHDAFSDKFPDKTTYEFDRLTFSQYQQLLLGEPCWSAYKDDFDLDVEHIRALLDAARELRNRIAHHRGLPTPAERHKLVYCRELLGRVADRRQEQVETEAPAPEPASTPAGEPQPGPSAGVEAAEAHEEDEEDDQRRGEQSAITTWLAGITDKDRVTLAFDALDKQLAGGLPRGAREHRSWWTNDEEAPQSAHWLDASWRVVSVNLTANTVTFGHNTAREEAYIAIFGAIFRRLAESEDWPLPVPSPAGRGTQNVVNIAEDGGQAWMKLGFSKSEQFRISLYIDSGDQATNKATFDALMQHRDELEQRIGASLSWKRLPHRRASRVALVYPGSVSVHSGEEAIDELADWVAKHVPRFYEAMRERYETMEG